MDYDKAIDILARNTLLDVLGCQQNHQNVYWDDYAEQFSDEVWFDISVRMDRYAPSLPTLDESHYAYKRVGGNNDEQ